MRNLVTVSTALAFTALFGGCAVEQVTLGEMFTVLADPSGACPALDILLVARADRSMEGTVYWDDRRQSSPITGVLHQDDTFDLTTPDVGGTQAARITGRVTEGGVFMTIHGSGGGCDGRSFVSERPHMLLPDMD